MPAGRYTFCGIAYSDTDRQEVDNAHPYQATGQLMLTSLGMRATLCIQTIGMSGTNQ